MTAASGRRPRARTHGVAALGVGVALLLTGCKSEGPQASQTPIPSQSPVGTTTASSTPPPTSAAAPTSTAAPTTTAAPTSPSATPSVTATAPSPTSATTKPAPTATPEPAPVVLLRAGDSSSKVRELQARLRQLRWYEGDVTDHYGTKTTAAVKGFQAKRGFPATGELDERTWQRVVSMTRPPTRDELNNILPKPVVAAPGKLSWDVDQRCLTGRVICISKATRMLTWVVEGVPQYQFDVRFGSEALPTREGTFAITWKKKDVISNLYHTPMPYSMFFSGGQAIHYSSNFARLGYNGSSHGCVNVR
ncbi:MAG TPA: L,D-transpeptidase family protein, partial [Intrasporangium sp.]|nr:L,D-transpeptidase family protein [Intrasporangium sp.]